MSQSLFNSTPSGDSSADELWDRRNRWFVELLGKHEQQLNAFVLALVPQWPDADEIVQQTRIRLWEQFDQFDPAKDFGAWSRSIAYFQVLTHRKKSGRQFVLSSAALENLAIEAERLEEQSPRHSALAECLEALSKSNRELLARYYGGEENLNHLAQALGRSFTSLRQLVFRLRKSLYRCVEQRLTQ